MKQTKQSILFSFVLAVMMLVGANTAFGQLTAIKTDGTTSAATAGCATADWVTAQTFIDAGGTIRMDCASGAMATSFTFTKSVKITTDQVSPAVSTLTIAAVAGTSTVTINPGVVVTLDPRVKIVVGGTATNLGVLVLSTNTANLAAAKIVMTNGATATTETNANTITFNAQGTLTNNGVIETGARGAVNPAISTVANAPTGVYLEGGILTAPTVTSKFGNIFFLGAYTVPNAATTFLIADGRGVGIGAAFTLVTTITTTFSRDGSTGSISVTHYAGTIAGKTTATLKVTNGTYTSSAAAVWTGDASDKLEVSGNTTFGGTATSSTGPIGGMTIGGTLTITATPFTAVDYTAPVEINGSLANGNVANFKPALTIKGGTLASPHSFTAGTYASLNIAAGAVVATATGATAITAAITNAGSFVSNSTALTAANFFNRNVGNGASRGAVIFTNNPAAKLTVAAGGGFVNSRIYLPVSGNEAIGANAASVNNYGSISAPTFVNFGGSVTNFLPSGPDIDSGKIVVTIATAVDAFVNSSGFFSEAGGVFTAAPATNTASFTNYGTFTVNGTLATWSNNGNMFNYATGTFTFDNASIIALSMVLRAGTNDVTRIPVTSGAPSTATGSFRNEGVLTGVTFTNHGTFTNIGMATFSTSLVNELVEKAATNTTAITTTSNVINSRKITTPTFTNTGGTVSNSDTLVVSLKLLNNAVALTSTRGVGEITNAATGVILAQRTSSVAALRVIDNLSTLDNNGIIRTDSLTNRGYAAGTSAQPLVTGTLNNTGTVVAHHLETTAQGRYNNSGTTTINRGTNCTAGCAPGTINTSGSVKNAGTINNTAGTMSLPGLTSNTSGETFSGAGSVLVTGGELTFRAGAMTFSGTLNVSGGTATVTGITTNSGSMTVSGEGVLTVLGALTNTGTLTRGVTTPASSAASGGTFTVHGNLTNNNAINVVTSKTIGTGANALTVAFGELTLAKRAPQGTEYLEGVLTAAATDGIIVRGNFTNNANYTGNVIVSKALATGTTTVANRTIAGDGVFGNLTLEGDVTLFATGQTITTINVGSLFLNGLFAVSTTEGSLTTGKFVNLVGSVQSVNDAGTELANGLSASGVFAGAAGRWSDKVTVKHIGANYASFGQTTATLANGPLTVDQEAGILQLVGDAFVKSAVLTGKVNRPTIFTFSTVDAMTAASTARVIVVNLNGGTVSMANVQFIHNIAGKTVDVSVDGVNYATNVTYQSATPYVSVPANAAASVVVTAGTTVLKFDPQILEVNKNYIVIFQGGSGKEIEMNVVSNARTVSNAQTAMQFIFNHGVTNGPAVTVERVSTTTPRILEQLIAVNVAYGSVTQYLSQTAPSYTTLRMKAGGAVVGQYLFDFTGNEGQAVTLLATGIAGGAGANALMIIAVDAAGDVMRPAVTTSDDNDSDVAAEIPAEFTLNGNFPNPFNPTTNISFDLPEQANVRIEIIDLLGRQVMAIAPQSMSAGANKIITVDAARLSSGVYFYRLIAEGSTKTFVQGSKFTLVK